MILRLGSEAFNLAVVKSNELQLLVPLSRIHLSSASTKQQVPSMQVRCLRREHWQLLHSKTIATHFSFLSKLESEHVVQEALDRLLNADNGMTTVVVAHRLHTVSFLYRLQLLNDAVSPSARFLTRA